MERAVLFLGTAACAMATAARAKTLRRIPPIARRAQEKVYYGKNPADPTEDRGPAPMDPPLTRTDEYHWLRDETRKDPEVLAHLAAENAYAEEAMLELQVCTTFPPLYAAPPHRHLTRHTSVVCSTCGTSCTTTCCRV